MMDGGRYSRGRLSRANLITEGQCLPTTATDPKARLDRARSKTPITVPGRKFLAELVCFVDTQSCQRQCQDARSLPGESVQALLFDLLRLRTGGERGEKKEASGGGYGTKIGKKGDPRSAPSCVDERRERAQLRPVSRSQVRSSSGQRRESLRSDICRLVFVFFFVVVVEWSPVVLVVAAVLSTGQCPLQISKEACTGHLPSKALRCNFAAFFSEADAPDHKETKVQSRAGQTVYFAVARVESKKK